MQKSALAVFAAIISNPAYAQAQDAPGGVPGEIEVPQGFEIPQDFESPAELFSVPEAALDRTPELSAKIDELYSQETTEELNIVAIDPERFTAQEILLSFGQRSYALTNEQGIAAAIADDEFTWSGATAAMDAPTPDFSNAEGVFAVDGDEVYGTIRADEGVFRVQPLADGMHAVVKVREEAFMPDHPPSGAELEMEGGEFDSPPVVERPGEPIDVLVLFTPMAAQRWSNTKLFSELAISATNESLSRSGVGGVKFRLVGTETLDLDESGGFDLALTRLVNGSDEASREAHQIREEKKADLVMMIVSRQMGGCGKAADIFANPSTAFAIMAGDCAIDNLTFPHEIGHLLGACHDPAQGHGCVPFPYGHGYQRPDIRQRSIMAYDCNAVRCRRELQWSRPPEWGDAASSHGARVLAEQAARTAGFR